MSRPLLLCTDVNYIFIIVIFISALKEGKISIKYERCSRFYKMVVSIYQSLGLVERGECQIKNLKLLDEPYGKHFNFGYSSNVQEKRIIRYLNQKIRGFFDGNYSDYIYLSTAKYCGSLYYSHGLSLLHYANYLSITTSASKIFVYSPYVRLFQFMEHDKYISLKPNVNIVMPRFGFVSGGASLVRIALTIAFIIRSIVLYHFYSRSYHEIRKADIGVYGVWGVSESKKK